MYLAVTDVAQFFVEKQGIQADLLFHTVTDQANILQPKGLFIPLSEDSGKLLEAIANGAIAAIWMQEKKLPSYTPNHFPVFFTSDMAKTVKNILQIYIEKQDGEIDKKMEFTNFNFSNKKLLNKNNETYDIAVMLKEIHNVHVDDAAGRE